MFSRHVVKPALIISVALILTALQANAASFGFTFAGPGVSGKINLTYGPATDAIYPLAFEVTGISGTFTDTNNGLSIVNAPIGLLVPLNHAAPEPTNLLAPKDFSLFAVAVGNPNGGGMSYDNLYWPGGSPQTATDYAGQGGFLDIYGLLFNIGGGIVVDFWSNGNFTGGVGPIDWGVGVATSATQLDYVEGGVTITPEPGAFGLLASGLLGMLAWRRRALCRKGL